MKKATPRKIVDIAGVNPPLGRQLQEDEPVSFVPMNALDAETGSVGDLQTKRYADVRKGYTPFLNEDLLVAKITPCFENGKIGQALLRNPVGFGSTEFHVIRPVPGLAHARYLFHFLRQETIRKDGEKRMTGSAGQRRVPASFFSNLQVLIPPMEEQKRIAAILDQADAVRAHRRTALSRLDELTQSIFLEMFGEEKSSRWKQVSVENIADSKGGSVRTGPFGSQLLHSEFTNEGIFVLGIDNVVSNEFRWGESRHISEEKYKQLYRYTVFPGDVLITIMGTCGRCAIVPENIQRAINTKHLCCITLNQEKCHPLFLQAYFLRHPTARKYLLQQTKGAIMSGMNMGIIKSLPVHLPPLALQKEFARRVEAVEKMKAEQREHLARLDELFVSLQHRAFRGEL